MHQKEKSVALLREIDEALGQNKPVTFFMNNKESLSFSERRKTSGENEKNVKNMNIQEQINNSFKNLSIQTINALISLKSDVNKQTPEFETTKSSLKTLKLSEKIEKNEENAKNSIKKKLAYTPEKSLFKMNSSSQKNENYKGKTPILAENVNELTKVAKKRIEEMLRNLKSSHSLDDLTKGLKEKMQSFQEAYENINQRIDELLGEMKQESKSPRRNEAGGGDVNFYTFQRTKKMDPGEKSAKKFEPFTDSI